MNGSAGVHFFAFLRHVVNGFFTLNAHNYSKMAEMVVVVSGDCSCLATNWSDNST